MASISETRQISKRYASALFKLSIDNNSLDCVVADVANLQVALSTSDDFCQIIKSPALKINEANAVLSEVLKGLKSGNELKGLAKTICDNRRQFALVEILHQFNALIDNHKGIVNAEVVSANQLKDKQVKLLEGVIADTVGSDVRVSYKIKPTIMGGLIVKIGSKMIDASIQTKLDKLKLEMKGA